ncbi:hypothetical protein ACFQ6C_25835 [Streptomyces sp. NPDC056454]|uniref:hypothetical protein n=1 Tax=Streptomyces sp. NPDC056454 TaxID=3345823 RepID=UPI00368A8560
MSTVSLHDVLVREFQLGQQEMDWLPEAQEVPEDYVKAKFASDRAGRMQLRLLANSAIRVLQNRRSTEYTHELKKVRFINSQKTAHAAVTRLLRVASWAAEDHGEEGGNEFFSAARLAEQVGEHYSGWPTDAYADTAGLYVGAVGGGFSSEHRLEICQTLKGLKALEPGGKE